MPPALPWLISSLAHQKVGKVAKVAKAAKEAKVANPRRVLSSPLRPPPIRDPLLPLPADVPLLAQLPILVHLAPLACSPFSSLGVSLGSRLTILVHLGLWCAPILSFSYPHLPLRILTPRLHTPMPPSLPLSSPLSYFLPSFHLSPWPSVRCPVSHTGSPGSSADVAAFSGKLTCFSVNHAGSPGSLVCSPPFSLLPPSPCSSLQALSYLFHWLG